MKGKSCKLLHLFVLLLVSHAGSSQPLNMDPAVNPTELKMFKYDPKGQPNGKGVLNITRVVQVTDTAYYFCKGLSIYSPAAVTVSVKDKSAPVNISLHKWNWKTPARAGATNEKGIWSEQFKTENDMGIMVVITKKPAIYNLFVWAGDEVKVAVPSAFASMKEVEKTGEKKVTDNKQTKSKSSVSSAILYIIIAVLVVAVIFLLIKKRKK